jgi:hypothetical protein
MTNGQERDMSLFVALLEYLAVFLMLLCVNIGVLPSMRLVLEECVELRCKRAVFHANHGKPSSIIVAVLAGALGIGMPVLIGVGAATRVVSGWLLTDSTAVGQFGWDVAGIVAGVILYQLIEGWRGYLAYRKRVSFRMWVRHVGNSGLAVAHNFYLAGWLRRTAKALYVVSVCELAVLVSIDVAPDMPPGGSSLNGLQMAELWSGIGIVAVCAFFRRVFFGLWSALRPDLELIEICTEVPLQDPPTRWREFNVKRAIRPGRWRTKAHWMSFRAATLVEICLSTMDRYIASGDMERVSDAGRRIAEVLRVKALHAADDDEALVAFEERRMLALLIVSSVDPTRYVPAIMRLTEGQSEPPVLARRKIARVAEAVNRTIMAYWSSLRVLLLVGGILLFLVFGRYSEVAGLLGK